MLCFLSIFHNIRGIIEFLPEHLREVVSLSTKFLSLLALEQDLLQSLNVQKGILPLSCDNSLVLKRSIHPSSIASFNQIWIVEDVANVFHQLLILLKSIMLTELVAAFHRTGTCLPDLLYIRMTGCRIIGIVVCIALILVTSQEVYL